MTPQVVMHHLLESNEAIKQAVMAGMGVVAAVAAHPFFGALSSITT